MSPDAIRRFPQMRRRADARGTTPRLGSVYVAVLGVAMIISIVSLAAIHLTRVELDALTSVDQIARAEFAAHSAVELAVARLKTDPSWRTSYVSGQENPSGSWFSLETRDNFKFVLKDDDGDLSDSQGDAITVVGIGRSGEAISVAAVEMEPSGAGLSCLEASLHAGGRLHVQAGGDTTTNQEVSSNAEIAVDSLVNGNAWSTGPVSGTVTGTRSPYMTPAREMPQLGDAWDYYIANGTVIDIDNISGNEIRRVVLSAANNPYGPENPQGIYIIDCEYESLKISDCRIEATLIVARPSGAVLIENTIHWQPPAPNFPAMMIHGKLQMKWLGGNALSESTQGVNFNPSGTPYYGVHDSDVNDTYPGVIQGLIYVSDTLDIVEAAVIDGIVIVGNTATVSKPLNLTYDQTLHSFPPPGFRSGNRMRIVPGSWRRTSQD